MKLPILAKTNRNIYALGINSSRIFWLKSLFTEKFNRYPGIKLYSELGERRKATEKETKRLHRRLQATSALKGNKYLWGKMEFVREISFNKAEKINLGKMTQGL